MSKLKNRIEGYQLSTDYKLLNRIPIVICINGKSFSKTTQLLDKPYCDKFKECILSTMVRLCHEIEGSVFGYQFNDEIVIISKNDQNNETIPWFDNKLQKICSTTSAIATMHFNECASEIKLNLTGDPVFTSQVFPVPNVSEAINTIIYKQQQNFHISVQYSCLYELIKKYDKNTIKEMLSGLSIDEKVDLLIQDCGVDFNSYPDSFRRGVACYKVPKISGDTMKNKWYLNTELPIFTKDHSFLEQIFNLGHDIFRTEGFA